jgi:hypothetical protein
VKRRRAARSSQSPPASPLQLLAGRKRFFPPATPRCPCPHSARQCTSSPGHDASLRPSPPAARGVAAGGPASGSHSRVASPFLSPALWQRKGLPFPSAGHRGALSHPTASSFTASLFTGRLDACPSGRPPLHSQPSTHIRRRRLHSRPSRHCCRVFDSRLLPMRGHPLSRPPFTVHGCAPAVLHIGLFTALSIHRPLIHSRWRPFTRPLLFSHHPIVAAPFPSFSWSDALATVPFLAPDSSPAIHAGPLSHLLPTFSFAPLGALAFFSAKHRQGVSTFIRPRQRTSICVLPAMPHPATLSFFSATRRGVAACSLAFHSCRPPPSPQFHLTSHPGPTLWTSRRVLHSQCHLSLLLPCHSLLCACYGPTHCYGYFHGSSSVHWQSSGTGAGVRCLGAALLRCLLGGAPACTVAVVRRTRSTTTLAPAAVCSAQSLLALLAPCC